MKIVRFLMKRIVYDDLVFGTDLHVISWFKLAISHMIVLHSHKGSIRICLTVTISISHNFFLLFISFKIIFIVVFYISQLNLGFGRSFRVVLDFSLYFLDGLFNFFVCTLFKVWWSRIAIFVLIVSDCL